MAAKKISVVLLLVVFATGSRLPAGTGPTSQRYVVGPSNNDVPHLNEAKPWEWHISGPWNDAINVSITPNPPRRDAMANLVIDMFFKEDVWSLSGKLNASLEGTELKYEIEEVFCGFSKRTFFCPAPKGETRRYEKHLNLGVLPKGTYSVRIDAFDQDDEYLATIKMKNCTLN